MGDREQDTLEAALTSPQWIPCGFFFSQRLSLRICSGTLGWLCGWWWCLCHTNTGLAPRGFSWALGLSPFVPFLFSSVLCCAPNRKRIHFPFLCYCLEDYISIYVCIARQQPQDTLCTHLDVSGWCSRVVELFPFPGSAQLLSCPQRWDSFLVQLLRSFGYF